MALGNAARCEIPCRPTGLELTDGERSVRNPSLVDGGPDCFTKVSDNQRQAESGQTIRSR